MLHIFVHITYDSALPALEYNARAGWESTPATAAEEEKEKNEYSSGNALTEE